MAQFDNMEIEIWGTLSGQHPNILELYGAVKYRQTVIIFMEYMRGKNRIVMFIDFIALVHMLVTS